jgi:hypothetical protein
MCADKQTEKEKREQEKKLEE